MFRIARLFVTLGASRLGDLRDRAGHRIVFLAIIGGLGGLFAIFALAAITAALATWLGIVAALAIMSFCCFMGAVAAYFAMEAVDRRHRERLAQKAALQRRLSEVAVLAAFGDRQGRGLRTDRVVGFGLIAGALALLLLGSREDDDSDG